MEPRATVANAEPPGGANEHLPTDEAAGVLDAQEGFAESFEAVIVRLDHATAEQLFRKASL